MLNLPKIYDAVYSSKQKIIDVFSYLLDFFHIKMYLTFILLGNFLLWILAYIVNSHVDQNIVILHYNVDFGVDLVGDVGRLYIVPALGFIIFLINMLLLFNFYKSRHFKFISHILLSTCLFVNLFLFASLASVYLINFR